MGRGPKRWSYTYEDLARLVGWSKDQVMRSVSAGQFDPSSLESVRDWSVRVTVGEVSPTRKKYGAAKQEGGSS